MVNAVRFLTRTTLKFHAKGYPIWNILSEEMVYNATRRDSDYFSSVP